MTICKKFTLPAARLAPNLDPAILFDQPVQKCRNKAQHNRANQCRRPAMDNKSRSDRAAAILSMMALITIRNKPKVTIVNGKVMILRTSPSVAFTNPKTMAAISAAAEAVQLKAGNNVSDNQQRHSINKPTHQQPHIVPSSPAKRLLHYCKEEGRTEARPGKSHLWSTTVPR